MKTRYFLIALLVVTLFAYTNITYGQLANITSDVQTEFGVYHPYLVIVTPAVATYTVSSDFSDVTNFSQLASAFTEADKSLLRQNHFVSKPSLFKQVYSLYNYAEENNIPQFVTTDALLHTFHILYDYSLRVLEVKRFADDLKALNHAMLERMSEYYRRTNCPCDSNLRKVIEKDIAYFTVVEYIPKPEQLCFKGAQLSGAERMACEELKLIAAHQGFAPSPIFGYKEDYSQYVPRGHYTRNDTLKIYFKQMMWYGRMMFRVSPPKNEFTNEIDEEKAKEETLMAILIVRAMNELSVNGEPAMNPWSRIYYPTTFFVGKSDDLDIAEYTQLLKEVYGGNYLSLALQAYADTVKLTEFITRARELRDPLINSSWVFETQDHELVTKAFRFMGQRFIPDSYMFTQLVHKKVLDRLFPKGLDVFSVMGSQRAFEILDKVFGETRYGNYTTQMDSLKREFAALSPETWAQNLYWNWLYCLMAMLIPKGEGYPPFMRNIAWIDKELFTALASWGELRHDTILYAKQSYTFETGEPPRPSLTYGYVEPNPYLFARLASLINLLRVGLDNLGLGLDEFRSKFSDLESLLLGLKLMSEKELENKELTFDEYNTIWKIGERLESLLTFPPETAGTITSDADNEMAVVADVHTDPNTGQVLEEGVGYPFHLYVIVKDAKGLRMTIGAMFSYYEFPHPMADRLTDEAWQRMLKSTNPPKPPNWADSFMDMSQSFLNPGYPDRYAKIPFYTEPIVPSLLPEHPSIGDTLTLRVVSKWPIGDTLRVVFSRNGQQLVSAILTDIDTSRNAEFVGQFPTKSWAPGVITIQINAKYFSSTYWFELGSVTSVDKEPAIPETFLLFQNYPNPFNSTTSIEFQIPSARFVSLKVHDVLGREVATLVDGNLSAGRYKVEWNASGFASGVYLYHLQASNFIQVRKMLLIR